MFSPRLCHNLLKLESSSCFCLPSPAVNFWDIVLRQEIQQVDAGFRQQIQLIHIFTEIKKKNKNQIISLLILHLYWLTDLYLLEFLNWFQSQAHSLTQVSIQVLLRQWFYLENINTHSQRGKYTVTQFNRIPVFLLCGSVCFVCSLCNNSAEKTTMLNAATRLPICVYKTNRARSYLNTRVTR